MANGPLFPYLVFSMMKLLESVGGFTTISDVRQNSKFSLLDPKDIVILSNVEGFHCVSGRKVIFHFVWRRYPFCIR